MSLDLIQFSTFNNLGVASQVLAENVLSQASAKIPKVKFHQIHILSKSDSAALQKAKKEGFVAVRGSSPELCSWAANSKGVHLLLQPFNSEKCFLDMQTANVLCGNEIFVGFLFNEFLEADGFRLSQLIKNAAMCVRLCENSGAKILFLSGAKNEWQLRAAKDLSSFATMLGMKKENALKSVRANAEKFLGVQK